MTIQNQILLPALLISLLCLGGCSTGRAVLPSGGPTMTQIYQQKMRQSAAYSNPLTSARNQANAGWLGAANTNLYGYTRTANNELNNLFPKLPNPTVAMFVYPHLAGPEEAPVPGYSTAFTLYKTAHFALPGELAKRRYR